MRQTCSYMQLHAPDMHLKTIELTLLELISRLTAYRTPSDLRFCK